MLLPRRNNVSVKSATAVNPREPFWLVCKLYNAYIIVICTIGELLQQLHASAAPVATTVHCSCSLLGLLVVNLDPIAVIVSRCSPFAVDRRQLCEHFWATVCKTVRPMLSDRCPVCPVRPVCDIGVLWPNSWTNQNKT